MVGNLSKEKIIIYGAGDYGKKLLMNLLICGKSNSIMGFAVSNLEGAPYEWDGYPVRIYDEYKFVLSKCIVYIAISPLHSLEVEKRVREDGALEVRTLTREWFRGVKGKVEQYCLSQPIDSKSILFYCYNRKGFRCNCKYLAQALRKIDRKLKIFWDVDNKSRDELPDWVIPLERDTLAYYLVVYTSSVIVTNEGKDNSIKKRDGQVFIQTWHGAGPFKKVGIDVPEYDQETKQKLIEEFAQYDICVSCTDALDYEYRHAFGYEGRILHTGFPRNDLFFRNTDKIRRAVYEKYHIEKNKRIVLYAPTFRQEKEKSITHYNLNMNSVLVSLEKRFDCEFQLMYRLHYSIDHLEQTIFDGTNVTSYPDMQELLATADVLITDYSSSMWDFSLQHKPVFLYQGDISSYYGERGFYLDPSKWPYPKGDTTSELCIAIEKFDGDKYEEELELFWEKYKVYDDGHAAAKLAKIIGGMIKDDRSECV